MEKRHSTTGSACSKARRRSRIRSNAVSAAPRSPSVPGRANSASILRSFAISSCSYCSRIQVSPRIQVPSDVGRCSGPLPRSFAQASPSATTSSRSRVARRARKPSRARSSSSSSGRHWELDQTPAVRGPTHIAEVGPSDSASDGDPQRRVAAQRRVDACRIVVGLELGELCSRSRPFQNNTWSRNSRRVVPISRSTNGCDSGTRGTVLISSISSTRRCACQR